MLARWRAKAREVLRALGPGVTTGAADDDPSGIATYSVVGAQFGTGFLWASWVTFPLMGAVQMMCARVGMVTGMGLAGALREKFPRALVALIALALLIANVINIAADLSGMADSAQMLGGGSSHVWVWVFGLGICVATVWLRYHQIANALKWLALALLAYVATAFLVTHDWPAVLKATALPSLPHGSAAWAALVALLGTTISPYLFFWQAGQEVEEEKAKGRLMLISRKGATAAELHDRRIDIGAGAFFSNVVMFFVILTTAMTLHEHGITSINTTRDAAQALKPLASNGAYLLYTLGLVGTGLLAIPTLAGSAAYAFAETFDWAHGLDERFRNAGAFYGVFILATVAGAALDEFNVDPIKALYWSAIVNGLLAPFLLVALLLVATDARIMDGQTSSLLSRWVVVITTVLMFGAAVGMFVF
ncbi:MAG: divalent metal cation transporter [Proteobacteria bacterium]|nr:divalent metal cation transporter [Pseudomonadota bacterium]MBS0460942.1 divalent metal cation transporter [Pseudomonadota bacterium]MBS0463799.1 divalent metal cation transporter [Pseudomonadota bacterium]